MMEIQIIGVLVVATGAITVPLGFGFVTSLLLPSVVLAIVVGILIGPVVLRLVEIDALLRILSLFMLAFHTAATSPTWRARWPTKSARRRPRTTTATTLSRKPSGCTSEPAASPYGAAPETSCATGSGTRRTAWRGS